MAAEAKVTGFHHKITQDGSSGFKAEAGRYHLIGGFFCPWAQRTMIARKLKGLDDAISFVAVRPETGPDGWKFGNGEDGCDADPIFNAPNAKTFYLTAEPNYEGRYTVPVLFDKQTKRIVNNESAEIIRILNSEFNEFGATPEQRALDLYPAAQQAKIEEVNALVLPNLNMGIYKCSMGDTTEVCDGAITAVFDTLQKLESILSTQRYLVGNTITEADVRLIVTLLRFNIMPLRATSSQPKRLTDFPNIANYIRDLYQMPAIKTTVSFDHTVAALTFFFGSKFESLNIKLGHQSAAEFEAPHNRAAVAAA